MGSLARGRERTAGLSTTAIFSNFAGYFFGNFEDEASIIILRCAVHSRLFSDLKMHDLIFLE